MFVHYRAKGLLLAEKERGEADKLLTLYTEDFGKLEILAKAVRKINSKLRGSIGLFYLSDIEFVQGKRYKTLTDAILIKKFDNVRKDLKRLKTAYRISELAEELIKEQEPDPKIWQLLLETFTKLNNSSFGFRHLSLLYYYFSWNLFSLLGYQPDLYSCSFCQKRVSSPRVYFSLKEGGLICQNCSEKVQSVKEQDKETLKLLRLILKPDWPLLSKVKVEKGHWESLRIITKEYLSYVLSYC